MFQNLSIIDKINCNCSEKYYIYNKNKKIMEIFIMEGTLLYLVIDRKYFVENKIKYSTGFTSLNNKRYNSFPDDLKFKISECLTKMDLNGILVLKDDFKDSFYYNQVLLNVSI